MSEIIWGHHIDKSFHVGTQDVTVLKDISFDVKMGDFLIIYGPSGCGKSTLLHIILGLESPTRGQVQVLSYNLYSLSEDERADFRKRHIGMVYQQPNWIRALTVIENVAFPLTLLGEERISTLLKAEKLLKRLEMADWASYIPTELSSGQQQKVALARALISNPELIIADEPTGNLDFESGQELMRLLTELNSQGKTILMVTHDLEYLKFAKTAIHMFNGQIEKKYENHGIHKLIEEAKSKRRNGNVPKVNKHYVRQT